MTENPATPEQPDVPEAAPATVADVAAAATTVSDEPVEIEPVEIGPAVDEPVEIEPVEIEPVEIEPAVDEPIEIELTDDEVAPVADETVADAGVDDEAAPTDDDATAAETVIDETVIDDEGVVDEIVVIEDVVPDEGVVLDEVVVIEDGVVVEDVVVVTTDDETASSDKTTAGGQSTEEQPAETPAPVPAPTAGPRPSPASIRPRPVPRPPAGGATTPAAPTAAPAPAVAASPAPAPVAPLDPAEVAAASVFGRVAEDGTVFVRDGEQEREVGQVPGASTDDALVLYVRRFLDLQAKVALFESRLSATDLPLKEIDATIDKLGEELAAPAAVGDLPGLRERLESLKATAADRRAQAEAERAAARAAALEARTALVEQAEAIAAIDPGHIQWRPAGEQLRVLLDQWKDAQRNGPRLDRTSEETLWKRFSHARTTFDRERRHFFAELETRNASAKNAKEALVVRAEQLARSTDWSATAIAFRDLMTEWKTAGRASRSVDDALWARFRAAQDSFFQARTAAAAATDEEFQANLAVKERLAAEAEALLPVKDLTATKNALRSIQDRWDAAGKVPRGDMQRIEGRLRAVEQAVRDADEHQWRHSNPETRARAEGMGAQLAQVIAGLEANLATARAAGDTRKIAEITAALDARRSWLEQVERAARDARG